MLGIAAVPASIQLIWMLFMPETQRWLAKKNRWGKCREVLNQVYAEKAAKDELESLKREVKRMKKYIE